MLFSRGSSTVVSVMSGGFDASSGVMLIVKVSYCECVCMCVCDKQVIST